MDTLPVSIDDCIRQALTEVEALMRAAFAKVDGLAPPGSALDQNGLRDGRDIVLEYLDAGEAGLALEHLIYMVHEPGLAISLRTFACVESAGSSMSLDKSLWDPIRPHGGPADR
jgi:hypothetical protein